jgi:hypothetical protein
VSTDEAKKIRKLIAETRARLDALALNPTALSTVKLTQIMRNIELAHDELRALYQQHADTEQAIVRSACEMAKQYAINVSPDQPPLRRVPYDITTTVEPDVLKAARTKTKAGRKRKGGQEEKK